MWHSRGWSLQPSPESRQGILTRLRFFFYFLNPQRHFDFNPQRHFRPRSIQTEATREGIILKWNLGSRPDLVNVGETGERCQTVLVYSRRKGKGKRSNHECEVDKQSDRFMYLDRSSVILHVLWASFLCKLLCASCTLRVQL